MATSPDHNKGRHLRAVPSLPPEESVPPVPEQRRRLTMRQLVGRAAVGLAAIGAVVMPSPYTVKFNTEPTASSGDKPAEVQSEPTTVLRPGESPWQTAARDLADAREGDPAPTDKQVQRGTEILLDRNHWISPEQAEPGRIEGMTRDERASILDNRPKIEMTTPPPVGGASEVDNSSVASQQ